MITLQGIRKVYPAGSGAVCALRGIDLEIAEGVFVSIVGRSGSGKSTLMNILGCLDTPTSGEYILRGQSLAHAPAGVRAEIRNREIGFIFQGYNLAPRLSALENVELPLMFRGMPRGERHRLAKSALEAVGLGERMQHYPAQLSGGQQQRVAIARAIAAHPPVILADEPTGSLDRSTAEDCLALLGDLNRLGHTVILITHDAASAARADRILTIEDGVLRTGT